jgi:hypothetical protein
MDNPSIVSEIVQEQQVENEEKPPDPGHRKINRAIEDMFACDGGIIVGASQKSVIYLNQILRFILPPMQKPDRFLSIGAFHR